MMNEKYIPLYRKYRPQRLEEIVGQEHIKRALKNAITQNKISHAYLFTGPRGTGKTSTARIFAKSLNCVEGPTINPCGVCENCVNITNSVPMDVVEIDAASNRKVEDAQNILEKVMYAPVSSRYKIYIIDEVHMLSNTAFNALLKTLEEPPKNVIFILATTEVHKVLDTIKSRCQRFDFKRITTEDIVKHLRYIADKESINITDDALLAIAKSSAGGMRDSIALLDQLSILDGEEAISTDDINNLLGRISFDILYSLAEAVANSNQQDAIEILEKIYNSGNEPTLILTNLLDYFKNLLIVKNCKQEIVQELTQLSSPQIDELKKQAEKLETQQITFLIDKTSDYIKDVKNSNNPRLWLEVGIIDLANLTENTKLLDLQNRITQLENGAPVQSSQATSNYKTPPVPVSTIHKIKEQLEENLAKSKITSEAKKTDIPQITKSEVKHTVEEEKTQTPEPTVEKVTQTEKALETQKEETHQRKDEENHDDFSPMPSSQPQTVSDGSNIAELWGQLLTNIQSAPTRALLKQWANPIKLQPDEIIITIKNELLLNQFVSGNKKKILSDAVDLLFNQTNSNIIVRLPQAGDTQVKPVTKQSTATPRQLTPKNNPPEPEPDNEEIYAAKKNLEKSEKDLKKHTTNAASSSDQVNMIVDLFDGKIID